MITINGFLKLEGSTFTKKLLLEAIQRVKNDKIEEEELTFNVYSIIIYSLKNEVLIVDDICPDENPVLTMPLDDFRRAIENFAPNES